MSMFANYQYFYCFRVNGRQIQAAFRTDEIRRTPPTPQDEMRAGMSYFHETIWNGLPTFLRRVDTALKSIGVEERLPSYIPLIQFSSWMGGDRDGNVLRDRFPSPSRTLQTTGINVKMFKQMLS